jgi:hypothetical protein
MVIKKFLVFGIFFALSIFLINNSLALSCSLKQTCDVFDTPGRNVVVSLSSQSNAHGALRAEGGNYPYKICCDFEGTDKCTGENGILSLSAITNAHAQTLDSGNYETDLCFGDLKCRSGSDIVSCLEDEFQVVSFSDVTNAHLGSFETYAQKVCCKWTANAYFADPSDLSLEKNVVGIGDRVALVLNNSGLDAGTGVYSDFQIFENDEGLNIDDTIALEQIFFGDVTSSGGKTILSGIWEITQNEYDDGKDCILGIGDCEPDEFYFVANGITSSYLKIISRDEGASFCEEFKDEEVCNSCSNHVDCTAAYNSANDISKEMFSVGCGETLLDDANYATNCFCGWDAVEESCAGGVSYVSANSKTIQPHCKNDVQDEDETGVDCGGVDCGICVDGVAVAHCKNDLEDENEEGVDCGLPDCGPCSYSIPYPKIGSCKYISQGDDDCSDGFLQYSWLGEWSWGLGNGFISTEQVFSNDPTDFVEADGLFYYDPLRTSLNCQGGSTTIPCPSQVQLPFFGFFGIVFSLVLISLIYLYLIFKNEKNF